LPFIDHNASPFSEERATRVSLLTHFSRELVRSLGEPPLAPIDHIIVSPSLSSPPAIFFAQLRNTRHPPVESHFSTRNPCLEPPPVFLRFAVSSRGAPGRPHLRHSHPHRPTHTDSTPIALSRDRHSGCFETARALQTNGGCFSQPYTLWRRYGVPRRRTPPARVRPGDQLLLRGERHTQSTTTGIDTILPMRLLSGTEYGAPRQQPVGVRPRLHHHVRPVPTCEGGNRRRAGFRDRRGDSPRRGLPGPSCGTLLLHAAPASRRRRNSVLESRVQRYSLHRAAAAPKDGRLPPARGGEREWACLSLHRFAVVPPFPVFAAGEDEPLPASLRRRDPGVSSRAVPRFTAPRLPRRTAGSPPHAEGRESGHASPYIGSQVPPSPCLLPEWTSLSLHLSVSPCIFSRNRPSPGIVIARAARIPGSAAPRQGPPRREPRDRDPRIGSPPTRAYTTLRPEPDPSRPSAVASPYSDHRQFIVRVYRRRRRSASRPPTTSMPSTPLPHRIRSFSTSGDHSPSLSSGRRERARDRFRDDGADTSAVASTRSEARSHPPRE